MEHQLTFADSEFSCKHRQTRKEISVSPLWAVEKRGSQSHESGVPDKVI